MRGMSAATLLEEVETAISACLKSQAYSIGGPAARSQQRAQLAQLMAARQMLLDETGVSASMASVAIQTRPT